MPSLILYGVLVILIIYLIIRIVQEWKDKEIRIQDVVAILGIVISVIIAQKVPPPTWPPIFNQDKLVFKEDFNDGIANGITSSGLVMEIINIDKTDKALQATNDSETEWRHFYFEKQDITNGIIEYSLNLIDYNLSLGNGSGTVALHFRSTPQERRYLLAIVPENQTLSLNYQGLDAYDGWAPLTKAASVFNLGKNTWHKIKIELIGSNITVYFDDLKLLSASDDRLAKGDVFFGIAPHTTVLFDDVKVWGK